LILLSRAAETPCAAATARRLVNRLGPVTLLAMLAAAASSAARAQGLQIDYDAAADTVSLQAAGVPFHEVLEALAEHAEIELDLPRRPKTPIRIDLTDVPLRTALDELLSGYNYTMTQDGQTGRPVKLWLMSADGPAPPEPASGALPAPPPPPPPPPAAAPPIPGADAAPADSTPE
jgi:hypothetical protein